MLKTILYLIAVTTILTLTGLKIWQSFGLAVCCLVAGLLIRGFRR